jgi:hypothetical protein
MSTIQTKPGNSHDLASLFAAVEKINHRLDKLENDAISRAEIHELPSGPHASLDKFNVAEAIADGIFGRLAKDKACTFEPNDKPCDHCSMCNSRGF